MRIMWRAWGLPGILAAAGLMLTTGALSANDGPVVHVKTVVKDGAVRLEAQANGPFEYSSYRPSENLLVLDLSGVSDGDPAGARVVASDLVKSYRAFAYSAGQKPVVRLEILLSEGVEPRFERTDSQELTVFVSRSAGAQAVPPAPAAAVVVPAAAKSQDTKTNRTSIESIEQVNLAQNGDETDVNVLGSGPLSYQATRLRNPDRLVLDFAGSRLKTSEKHIASNLDPVREIRLAQFTPQVSRMVIDLREPARYNIDTVGNTVTVSFLPETPAGAAVTTTPPERNSNLTRTRAKASKRAASETAAENPGGVPAPAAILPADLTRSSSALAIPVPLRLQSVAAIERAPEPVLLAPNVAIDAPPPLPVVVQQQEAPEANPAATEASTAAPSRADNSSPRPEPAVSAPDSATPAAVDPAPRAPARAAQAVAPQVANKFSGEPISVNLKDVDLRDFFRLIHEISGLNVVVDPAVKGNLTIVLDDVPWDQALDIVLHNNGLDKQLDGNVLRVATKDTLRREAEENRDLAKAQVEAADVVTTTRVLSYAKATGMAATLKKFLSSRGDILADDRSNTLIIRDIPSTLPIVDNLLRQLDRKSQQVEIEARVVAANRSFAREIGTELGLSGRIGNQALGGDNHVGAASLTFTPAPPIFVGSSGAGATSGQTPLALGLGTLVPTSGIQYAFSSPNFALDFILDAAETRGVGKLLSKPKVITQNNQKATVKQGTKIPVQTVINNTVSVQFVDAVLQLDVTPQITADGTIFMDVTVQNDQIDQAIPRVQGIPAIDTQSAQTDVTVTDGSTVVIGGIIVTQQQTAIQQVPLLGSLPVVGNLFRHTTVSSTSQELLFFLTPRILPS
jgi:type IV pilus secretin PilQ/predicted competence protein